MGDRSAHIPDMICIQPQRWKTRVDFINSKQTKKNMVSKASAMAPSIKNVANWRQVSKNWNWSSTGIWRVIVFWEGRLEVSEIYMYESERNTYIYIISSLQFLGSLTWNENVGTSKMLSHRRRQLSKISSRWHCCQRPRRPAPSLSGSPIHSGIEGVKQISHGTIANKWDRVSPPGVTNATMPMMA